jgi:hypothetical protein
MNAAAASAPTTNTTSKIPRIHFQMFFMWAPFDQMNMPDDSMAV